jgi:hypothetical protein
LCLVRRLAIAMIIGAHSIIYSTKPDADRALLRDVFKLPHVDVGDGWLIPTGKRSGLRMHIAAMGSVSLCALMKS